MEVVLSLAGMELTLFTAVGMVLGFAFVTKTVLITLRFWLLFSGACTVCQDKTVSPTVPFYPCKGQ